MVTILEIISIIIMMAPLPMEDDSAVAGNSMRNSAMRKPQSPDQRMQRKLTRILMNQEEDERDRRALLAKLGELESNLNQPGPNGGDGDFESIDLPLRSVNEVVDFDRKLENKT